ncbi:hypothetical protein ES703_123723 [subsurface metagenome]
MLSDIYPRLFPADIGAVKGRGPLLWLSQNLLKPKTDRIHFFLIGDFIAWDDDYVILESIGKGIAVGRLSFYKPEDIEIYRVNLNPDIRIEPLNRHLRRRVAAELTRVGRARYDYILYVQLILGALTLLLRGKLPPWRSEEFPYGRDRKYICTEAASEAWRAVGHPLIPKGTVPTPAAFRQALMDNKMRIIFPGRGTLKSHGR